MKIKLTLYISRTIFILILIVEIIALCTIDDYKPHQLYKLAGYIKNISTKISRNKLPKIASVNLTCKLHSLKHYNLTDNQFLYRYRWVNLRDCISEIDDMRQLISFPNSPTSCQFIDQTQWSDMIEFYGERIFGLIRPPKTAYYKFNVITTGNAELWLSQHQYPTSLRRIIMMTHQDSSRRHTISDPIALQGNQSYFIEFLHTNIAMRGYVEIQWRYFDGLTRSTFETLDRRYFQLPSTIIYTSRSHQIYRMTVGYQEIQKLNITIANNNYTTYTQPLLNVTIDDNLLPKCSYKVPSYISRHKKPVKDWEGDYLARGIIRHRFYGRLDFISLNNDKTQRCSPRLDKVKALRIVNHYMQTLDRATNGSIQLIKLISVEEKIDNNQGKRYYIELLVKYRHTRQLWRISDYLYQPYNQSQFCQVTDMKWNQQIYVDIVIVVQQQGQWIKYFIDQVSQYYYQSGDEYFGIIVVDFGSTDINIHDELYRSPLKNFKVIQLGSQYPKFIKTIGLNRAIKAVTNPNDIILIFDLHFNFPMDVLDNARKRSFMGKTAYAPIILRLNCYATPWNPNGFREIFGYGILAMYKSDFTRTDGYDSINFREQWGGEDVQMINSIFSHNLDVERVCHPTLYHHYHRALPWKFL